MISYAFTYIISLCLVEKVGSFINVEIDKSPLFMDGMASKVLAEEDMPIGFKFLIHELLQVFCHLSMIFSNTFCPSLAS
jgi:hypothetical protein